MRRVPAELLLRTAPSVPLYRVLGPGRWKEWPTSVARVSDGMSERQGETLPALARRAVTFAVRLAVEAHLRHGAFRRRSRSARRARRLARRS